MTRQGLPASEHAGHEQGLAPVGTEVMRSPTDSVRVLSVREIRSTRRSARRASRHRRLL